MRRLLTVLLVILASFGAVTTRLEISGDTIILSYSDSRDAVIFRREESNTGYISPMKIDIPGTWTLDAKPTEIPDISRNKLWAGISGDNYSYTLMSTAPAEWQVSGLPRGLSCSLNGKISGVPSEAGIFSVDVTASNIAGHVSQSLPLKIFADHLPRILTNVLPVAILNVSYDFKLSMNDSPSSILMAEKIPKGLTLDNDGKIRGVPVEAGDYILDIKAANEAGESSAKVALKVSSSDLKVTPARLSDGYYGRAYRTAMKLTGGEGVAWDISGRLPEGLSFDGGVLSGTPKETGKFSLTITGSNGAVFASSEYELTVRGHTPSISTSSLKQGFTGTPYSFALKASSRTPVTWSCDPLPEGLVLNPKNGTITGVPTKDFDGKVTFSAINAEGKVSRALSLSIKTMRPRISTSIIPDAFKGEDYHADFRAEGAGIKWTLRGKIPSGLRFNDEGVIEGVPEQAGRFPIVVSAENSGGKATRKFTLIIAENVRHDYVTIATMPAITVSADGRYDFPVSIDASIPEGSYIVWHSFPYGLEAENEDYSFIASSGNETITVPSDHKITVNAFLEGGVRYEPVITARVRIEEEPEQTEEETREYSGCNVSGIFGALMFLLTWKLDCCSPKG